MQALNVGGHTTDTFNYTVTDGALTDTATLTITINGANDAAVISGTTTGSVTEASGVNNGTPGTPTATATLTDTDVDNASNSWISVSSAPSDSWIRHVYGNDGRKVDLYVRQHERGCSTANDGRNPNRHVHGTNR